MWPSGRRRSPAKGVGPKGSRGFESHRLRHFLRFINSFIFSDLPESLFYGTAVAAVTVRCLVQV
jgi:hypothetical protein